VGGTQTLIPIVLGLGLAIAVCSPVSVVTVIVLLTMPSGRRRAIAFVVGWPTIEAAVRPARIAWPNAPPQTANVLLRSDQTLVSSALPPETL
jgi:hypothetical protein